eukprot:TRINITY_DN1126_c3_g1_i1.p1 TRINITY_DN1126_c3_g1~~TRINITY_DN1126_c3_g1_i1.p1  ORF type:complete len:697 (+),score=154.07 TRINITY_DN1126_c3_g1_i1:27-2117(+)
MNEFNNDTSSGRRSHFVNRNFTNVVVSPNTEHNSTANSMDQNSVESNHNVQSTKNDSVDKEGEDQLSNLNPLNKATGYTARKSNRPRSVNNIASGAISSGGGMPLRHSAYVSTTSSLSSSNPSIGNRRTVFARSPTELVGSSSSSNTGWTSPASAKSSNDRQIDTASPRGLSPPGQRQPFTTTHHSPTQQSPHSNNSTSPRSDQDIPKIGNSMFQSRHNPAYETRSLNQSSLGTNRSNPLYSSGFQPTTTTTTTSSTSPTSTTQSDAQKRGLERSQTLKDDTSSSYSSLLFGDQQSTLSSSTSSSSSSSSSSSTTNTSTNSNIKRVRIKTTHNTYVAATDKGDVYASFTIEDENCFIWTRIEVGRHHRPYSISISSGGSGKTTTNATTTTKVSYPVYAFKSYFGFYLTCEKGKLFAKHSKRTESDVFIQIPVEGSQQQQQSTEDSTGGSSSGEKISLLTLDNEFVTCLPSGKISTNKIGPQPWESFEFEVEPFTPPVFGGMLSHLMMYQRKLNIPGPIPKVIEFLCKSVLELNGKTTEDIFKNPGSSSVMKMCKSQLQKGNYSGCKFLTPHIPANLLKLFFRELKQPLIETDYNSYTLLIKLTQQDDINGMVSFISKLEEINIVVLEFMLKFLRMFLTSECIEKTKMDSYSLAVVFAPNFIRCPNDPLLQVESTNVDIKFVQIMLERFPPSLLKKL